MSFLDLLIICELVNRLASINFFNETFTWNTFATADILFVCELIFVAINLSEKG